MGIDYGTKRVGIAFTDEGGAMAFPHAVVPNDNKLVATISSLAGEKKVGTIIIGHSMNLDGSDNKVQQGITELIGDLTLETGLPIELEPEQYSTQAALRLQGRTEMTDASAAALILESYLTRTKQAS